MEIKNQVGGKETCKMFYVVESILDVRRRGNTIFWDKGKHLLLSWFAEEFDHWVAKK